MDENQPTQSSEKQSGSQSVLIAAVVIAIVVIALGYLWVKTQNSQKNALQNSTQPPITSKQQNTSSGSAAIITLNAQSNSGETGMAFLKEINGKLLVGVTVNGEPQGAQQPSHFHTGTCANPGKVIIPLTTVADGKAETTLNMSMSEFQKQLPLVLNVHKSATEVNVYVACGSVSQSTIMQSGQTQEPPKAATQTPAGNNSSY